MDRRGLLGKLLLSSVAALSLIASGMPASASVCTPTTLFRDGHFLKAFLFDPATVTGDVDAMGCEIAIYIGPGMTSTIDSADIHDAVYFGLAVQGGTATIQNSTVHDIGDTPLSGAQHGVGIAYVEGATGTADGNTVRNYQKNGMLVNGIGTRATITNNRVTGSGPTSRIAQNGIQVSRGATASVIGNVVSDNIYTQNVSCAPDCVGSAVGVISTGFLFFQAGADYKTGGIASNNHAFRNQCNFCVIP